MASSEMNKVLVVVAHPDDEVLGCGGTIARHADFGDQVQVLIVAEGLTSRQQVRDRAKVKNELSDLAKAAQTAGSILGAAGVELLDLPDNRLDSLDHLDLIKQWFMPYLAYTQNKPDVPNRNSLLREWALAKTRRAHPWHMSSTP